MKKIFLSIILIVAVHVTHAQKISMYKTFGGVRFTRADTVLSDNQVAMLLNKENAAAYTEFKRAKNYRTAASILGFAGGFLVAFPLGTAVVGGDPEWTLAAGGAALLLGSIPLNRIYKARTLNALDLYNEKLTSRIQPSLYFNGRQVGLVIRF